jgi:hypothetical protein
MPILLKAIGHYGAWSAKLKLRVSVRRRCCDEPGVSFRCPADTSQDCGYVAAASDSDSDSIPPDCVSMTVFCPQQTKKGTNIEHTEIYDI